MILVPCDLLEKKHFSDVSFNQKQTGLAYALDPIVPSAVEIVLIA